MVKPLEQEHSDEGCPNLNAERVFASADEGFDFEGLLEGFEKEFNFPAVFIDVRDGGWAEFEVVGQKNDLALVFLVPYDHAAKQMRTFLGGSRSGQPDDFIGDDVAVLGDWPGFDHLVDGVILHAGDEEDALLCPESKEFIVVVCAVHGDD